jgi:hypothetical protein
VFASEIGSLYPFLMTTPPVSPADATPDYSKVRGWLLVFALYAGFMFVVGIGSILFLSEAQRGLTQQFPSTARQIHTVGVYVGYVMLLVHLGECIAIFRRLRIGRTLALVSYGWRILYCLAWLPFMGAFIEATKMPPAPKGVDPVAYAKSVSATVTLAAYFSSIVTLALCVASLLYFLRSERVKRTLVN